jgi:hypothetical protein
LAARPSTPEPSLASFRSVPPPPVFDRTALGGHSLKRGALSIDMDRGVHKSYALLDDYLELGDPFESHPFNGVV